MTTQTLYRTLIGAVSLFIVAAGAFHLVSKLNIRSRPNEASVPRNLLEEEEELPEFTVACEYVNLHNSIIPPSIKLRLYGLYKQGTVGEAPADVDQSIASHRGAMGRMWTSVRGVSRLEAQRQYVEGVEQAKAFVNASSFNSQRPKAAVTATSSAGKIPLKSPAETATTPMATAAPRYEHSFSFSNVVSRPVEQPIKPEDLDDTPGGRFAQFIVHNDHRRVLEELQRDTSKANLRDRDGLTPLHWAADRGRLAICEDLLRFGAEISAQCDYGDTPLHLAAISDQLKVIELLIARGARSDLKNKEGELVEDVSRDFEVRQMIRTLFVQQRFPKETHVPVPARAEEAVNSATVANYAA
jgi:acyl-CoA-binding protein